MKTCKTCAHWLLDGKTMWGMTKPIDPDTYEEMEGMHEVRRCTSPALVFHEFPPTERSATVADGSNYMGHLYTAEKFGCVNHKEM